MSVSNSVSQQVSTYSGSSRVSHRHARAFSGGEPLAVELEAHLRFRENKERSYVVTSGVPSARVRQILGAVLELAMLEGVETRMLQVDVHRGDTGRYRHDFGLALAMAMVSSLVKKPIAPVILLLGDVDLRGNVRDVPAKVIDRLNDAVNAFEIETPLTVVLAPDSATWVNASSTVNVLPVPSSEKMLRDIGVIEGHIHTESFGTSSKPAGLEVTPSDNDAGFTVTFSRSNKSAKTNGSVPILACAEDLGIDVDSECRSGICGRCKYKLLSGSVGMETQDALDNADRKNNIILLCQARPLGDVAIQA